MVRSLLEKDKLTFSMLIVVRIMQEEKKSITALEVRFLMVGGTAITHSQPNPAHDWLSDKQWAIVEELSTTISSYKGLSQDFVQNHSKWKEIYNSLDPYNSLNWPGSWATALNAFQKLLLVRIIRPDKFITGVQQMIKEQMD